MKRILALALGSFGTALAAVLLTLPAGGCGSKSGTGPVQQQQAICDLVSFSSSAQIDVAISCNQGVNENTSFTNGTYDQFSRVLSYDFDFRCADGTSHYSGHVSNIQWNNLGNALSAKATVNGHGITLTNTYNAQNQLTLVTCTEP